MSNQRLENIKSTDTVRETRVGNEALSNDTDLTDPRSQEAVIANQQRSRDQAQQTVNQQFDGSNPVEINGNQTNRASADVQVVSTLGNSTRIEASASRPGKQVEVGSAEDMRDGNKDGVQEMRDSQQRAERSDTPANQRQAGGDSSLPQLERSSATSATDAQAAGNSDQRARDAGQPSVESTNTPGQKEAGLEQQNTQYQRDTLTQQDSAGAESDQGGNDTSAQSRVTDRAYGAASNSASETTSQVDQQEARRRAGAALEQRSQP